MVMLQHENEIQYCRDIVETSKEQYQQKKVNIIIT